MTSDSEARGAVCFIMVLLVAGVVALIRPSAALAATLHVCASGCPYTSIQTAINAAQTGDTIMIGAGTYTENLRIASPVAATRLTLTGAGAPQTVVDGNQQDCALNVDKKYTVIVSAMTFTNGNRSTAGGILNDGNLILSNVTISHNQGVLVGGIASDTDGRVTLLNSTVKDNTSDNNAGGILNDGGMMLSNVRVIQNKGPQVGGIANDIDGTLILVDSTLSDNASSSSKGGFGGGLLNFGMASLTNTIVSGNTAPVQGGGIENRGQLSVANSRITKNTTQGIGGGLDNRNNLAAFTSTATVTLSHTLIDRNTAFTGGGFLNDGFVTLNASSIRDNAAQEGGGLENSFKGTMTVTNSLVTRNAATIDGGGIVNDRGKLTVNQSLVIENEATSKSAAKAGGLAAFGGTVQVNESLLGGNSASGPIGGLGGGIVITDNGNLTLVKSPVIFNSASTDGGGIFLFTGSVSLQASPVLGNRPNNCVNVPGC